MLFDLVKISSELIVCCEFWFDWFLGSILGLMFSSGGVKMANNGGGSLVLIPHVFVWPYGGRNVYLTGSFTRWSDHVPMTPVEGNPTIFRTVCSLPPGYHEYKFFVDGEWRHDENKPCACGMYGIVNTVVLGAQNDHKQDMASSQISPASSMDLDHDGGFQHTVRVSDCTYQSPLPGLLHNDIEISRHRVLEYMSLHTVFDMLPDSGKVIALQMDLPVKQAFHILYEQGCAHAPIWDACKGQFVGVVSPLDFILMLRELRSLKSNISEVELEIHTISAWKAEKSHLDSQIGSLRRGASRGLIQAGPSDSLKDLALHFLENEVSTVPIMQLSSEDASLPQLLHLASLSEILKSICRYFRKCLALLPILQLPISTLHLGTWAPTAGEMNIIPLAILRPNDRLSTALNLLLQAKVSSIPIVDDNGSLLGIYSRSDITALAKDSAYARINVDEFSIGQALQFGNSQESSRCQVCLRTDTLFKVMDMLAKPGVRRLVIVEQNSRRVEGIISLSDIFKFFLG